MESKPAPEPLEGNDVLAVAVGTVLWLLVGIVLIPFHRDLNNHGHLWWIAASFTGAGLGCVGLFVTTRRRRRITPGRSPA